jgi:ATP-dependent protease ClpP protease subunit
VTLILNSLGGSVADGFFLANYLSNYSKKLDIIVTGYAASMAAVILSAGGEKS